MKTIGFICGGAGPQFLKPIIDDLKSDYTVVPMGGIRRDWLEQCDILWFEWGDAAVAASSYLEGLKDAGKKIVCRIHSFEVFEPWLANADWSQLTDIIFVADHVKGYANGKFNLKGPKQHVIWNGIKVEDYPENDLDEVEDVIVCYGSINHKKGIQLGIHAFDHLYHETRSTHRLKFVGPVQDERYVEYLSHMVQVLELQSQVEIHGAMPAQQAFKNASHVAVFSPWEGCPVGLLEGMAMGCLPLIHDFPGADKMYQPEWLWRSINDFADIDPEDAKFSPRDWVKAHFSFERQMARIREVLEG